MTVFLTPKTTDANTQNGYRADLSSGSLASLGASETATVVFDLGAQNGGSSWMQTVSILLALANAVDSAGSSIKAYWSDDGRATNQVPAAPCYNVAGGGVNYTGGLSAFVMQLMVMKRFLRVVVVNGATPQGASCQMHGAILNV